MVSQGLQCLKNSASSTTSLYTQALLAYTFSLAGEMDLRNMLLEKLDQQAIISGMLAILKCFFFLNYENMLKICEKFSQFPESHIYSTLRFISVKVKS